MYFTDRSAKYQIPMGPNFSRICYICLTNQEQISPKFAKPIRHLSHPRVTVVKYESHPMVSDFKVLKQVSQHSVSFFKIFRVLSFGQVFTPADF